MASLYTSAALKALKLKLSTKKDKENQPVNSDGQTEFRRPLLKSNVSLLCTNKTIHDTNRTAVRENGNQEYSLINAEEGNQNVQSNREEYQEVVYQVRERKAQRPAESQQGSSAPEFSFAVPQRRAPKSARPSYLDVFNNFKQTIDDFYNNEIMTDCEMDYYLLKLTCYALKNLAKATKNVRSEDDGFSHSALMDGFQRTGLPHHAPSLVGSLNSYMGRNSVSRFSVGSGLQNTLFQPIHQPFGSEYGDSVIGGPHPRSGVSSSRPSLFNNPAPEQFQYTMDRNLIVAMNRCDDRSQPQIQSSRRRSNLVPGTPTTSRYGRVIRTPCFYKANEYSAAHNKAEISVRERSLQTGKGEKQPKENDKVGERSSFLSHSRPGRQSILEDRPIRNQKRKREDSIGEEAKRYGHTPHRASTSKDETSLRTRSGRIVREPVKFWSQDYSPVGIIEERPNLKRKRSSITHHGKTVAVIMNHIY